MRRLAGLVLLVLTVACTEPEGTDAAAGAPDEDRPAATPADDALTPQVDDFIAAQGIDTSAAGWRTRLPKPPEFRFPDGATISWDLQTSEGPMRIRLWPDVAPMHVSSTLYLTRLGFYDGLRFHRVIPGFMAQGGCPLGTGTGGPGYTYMGEIDASVEHDRAGLLSMAHAGPGTDGSQFFLTFADTPWLDGKHTLFGEIVGEEGMATLRALEAAGTPSGQPTEVLVIESAEFVVE